MNKTSTGKVVCPYFSGDGRNYIRCEVGGKKITTYLSPEEMKSRRERCCYVFDYKKCPVAAINEKIYNP